MKHPIIAQVLLIFVVLLSTISGCKPNPEPGQFTDTIPPVFVNLVFPEEDAFIPEGELLITGQLIDDESGYDPDMPLYLIIDVLGAQGQVWSHTFNVADCESPDPSYFNFETGEFQIEFGDYRRLKPYNLHLHLYGVDGVGNVSAPVEAHVQVVEVQLEPSVSLSTLIHEARMVYGEDMLSWLDAYRTCLAVYVSQYIHDIQVIDYLKQFFTDTYVNSRSMDTWTIPMDTLVDQITALPHADTRYKATLDSAILFFQWYLEEEQAQVADPFYLEELPKEQFPEKSALIASWYDHDFLIDMNVDVITGIVTCHISLSSLFYINCDPCDLYKFADYTIVADPNSPLFIAGVIGTEAVPETIVPIVPEDYDPPLVLFNLFNETGAWQDLLIIR